MHHSSYKKMQKFVTAYLKNNEVSPLKILDIGSTDINGTYKPLFTGKQWDYTGADLEPGKNVDIVLHDTYHWKELKSNYYDVVVCGQVFEHVEFFWLTALEIVRILKNGGLCCIIAPSAGFEHNHPVDCWRFYPDGFRALSRYTHLEALEIYKDDAPVTYFDKSEIWKDVVFIGKKTKLSGGKRLKMHIKRHIMRIVTNW